MPRVTISVIAPNTDWDNEILTLDLPPGLSLADLRAFVHAETNLSPNEQQFYLNNTVLQGDTKSVEELGVKDGDMLAMLMRQPRPPPSSNPHAAMGSGRRLRTGVAGQPRQQGLGQDPDEIETTRLSILGNPGVLAQLNEQRPALADAVNDSARFRDVWMDMKEKDDDRERERLEQMRLLNEDPFNVEAQSKIEEMIRQQSVQENLQFAYEHNPEVFGRVTMLYVPVTVNRQPVKAFVDSGAQTTIMSPSCAEACGIMRLIDKRYSGVARGVGTAAILGRVHSADIRIGTANMSCSFTVMEGKDVDLLLGLDMLRRFQAVIDLRRNRLVFGDCNEVEFLPESEIPHLADEAMRSEPTIAGPNGQEVGAQSGTIRPSGSAPVSSEPSSSTHPYPPVASASSASASTPASLMSSSRPAGNPQSAETWTSSAHPAEKIEQLVSLGFDRRQAITALDACDGNVEYAAGLLFQT